MKTKLAIVVLILITVCGRSGVPWPVDTTTPHITGTNTYYGDDLLTAFTKANSNTTYFAAVLATNAANTAALQTSLATVSNRFAVVSNTVALNTLKIGTNALSIAANYDLTTNALTVLADAQTQQGIFNSLAITNTQSGVSLAGTLTGTFSGTGTGLTIDGTMLTSGTVNSNAFDYYTLAWLQSSHFEMDSSGNGGMTIHIKAQDNGSDVYIHVTAAGVVTASGSP